MGNWRAVTIEGTCAPEDVPALRRYLRVGFEDVKWGPLHNGGIAGLPNWAAEKIDASGNLGERDYGMRDVKLALEAAAAVAPSLRVKVHCGGEREDPACVATVTILGSQRGARIGLSEIDQLREPPASQAMENLQAQLSGGRR